MPSGCTGIVQDIRVVTHGAARRKEIEAETPAKLKKQVKKINDDYKKKNDQLTEQLTEKLSDILLGEKIPARCRRCAVR